MFCDSRSGRLEKHPERLLKKRLPARGEGERRAARQQSGRYRFDPPISCLTLVDQSGLPAS
jgi:hypothetical protein